MMICSAVGSVWIKKEAGQANWGCRCMSKTKETRVREAVEMQPASSARDSLRVFRCVYWGVGVREQLMQGQNGPNGSAAVSATKCCQEELVTCTWDSPARRQWQGSDRRLVTGWHTLVPRVCTTYMLCIRRIRCALAPKGGSSSAELDAM